MRVASRARTITNISTAATGQDSIMERGQRAALYAFCVGMIALGVLGTVYQDFAFDWQPVPAFHPGRELLAVVCGLLMIGLGIGLLLRATQAVVARALLPFLLAWLCLKIPTVLAAPQIEGVWIGFGEVGMLLGGGWVLFACLSELEESRVLGRLAGQRGIWIAQIIFGLAVIPVGLGHLFYVDITTSLVPSWLPFRVGLAYLTGIAQIACGLAIVFSIRARLAAAIETVLVALFAFLVWGPDTWIAAVPKMAGTPHGARFPLTAFLITWMVGASAWLIRGSAHTNSKRAAPG
jgi:uncharacterized membrane protein